MIVAHGCIPCTQEPWLLGWVMTAGLPVIVFARAHLGDTMKPVGDALRKLVRRASDSG